MSKHPKRPPFEFPFTEEIDRVLEAAKELQAEKAAIVEQQEALADRFERFTDSVNGFLEEDISGLLHGLDLFQRSVALWEEANDAYWDDDAHSDENSTALDAAETRLRGLIDGWVYGHEDEDIVQKSNALLARKRAEEKARKGK